MGKFTSRVFACQYALYQLLDAQVWPADETSGEAVQVLFGAIPDPPNEVVAVVGSPPSPSDLDVATNLSEAESFVIRTWIQTSVPGRSPVEAWARCEQLADVMQAALRDLTTGRMTNAFNGAAAQFPVDGVMSWRVGGVRPVPFPMKEGHGAFAELDTVFKTHI